MTETRSRGVFVTGAAGGIGQATVRRLAESGYVVFAGVHDQAAELAQIAGVQIVAIDVADPRSVAAAAAQVAEAVGGDGVHAVINNAGVIVQGPLELVPPEQLRRQFEINTLGLAYVTQAFLPLLRAGQGRVINISAPTARVAVPFMAPISASKAAIASMSDALRLELAPWKIPVVVIEPGGTQTEIFAKADASARDALSGCAPDTVALYSTQLAAVAKAVGKQKLGPVDPVAKTIVKATTVRHPKRHYTAGSGTAVFGFLSHLPAGTRDRIISTVFGLGQATAPTPG